MTLKCIIVDDEEMAIKVIESHLQNLKNFEIVGTYLNAIEAFSALQMQDVDVMFLDIQMPQMTGIGLLKSLPKVPHVIFTTAHREFALEGYELNVIDYLLKPIAFERFMKAIGKVLQTTRTTEQSIETNFPPNEMLSDAPFIYIKSDRQFVKILLDDIDFIESMKNHLKIVTAKNIFTTMMTISKIEEKLPAQRFLRIHRSFIVSVAKIEQFNHSSLTIGKHFLPIGNFYKTEVIKRLGI